jgi:hypothetical protein
MTLWEVASFSSVLGRARLPQLALLTLSRGSRSVDRRARHFQIHAGCLGESQTRSTQRWTSSRPRGSLRVERKLDLGPALGRRPEAHLVGQLCSALFALRIMGVGGSRTNEGFWAAAPTPTWDRRQAVRGQATVGKGPFWAFVGQDSGALVLGTFPVSFGLAVLYRVSWPSFRTHSTVPRPYQRPWHLPQNAYVLPNFVSKEAV